MEGRARKLLAKRVRMLRVSRGWSQETLAEMSGLHRNYIGHVERAELNIGIDNIERLADTLDISPSELLVDHEGILVRQRRRSFTDNDKSK